MTKQTKKAAKTAAATSKFFSLKTGRPVTEAWAKRNPTKAIEGVSKLPKGAVIDNSIPGPTVETAVANVAVAKKAKKTKKAAKKTRLVKRVKSGHKGGTFAKKTSTGGNVRTDFIDAIPTPKKTALKKAEVATKKATKAVKVAKKAVKKADRAVTRATKLTDAIGASTAALAKKRPGSKIAKKALKKSGTRGG